MSGVAVGLQVFGAVQQAGAARNSAALQKATLQSQARLSEINAGMSELGAQSALQQGNAETARLTIGAGQLKGRQRAAMAANGVDLGVGSAAEVQASSEILKNIDVDTIRANAQRSAWGQRVEALNYRTDAAMKRAGASGISPGMAYASSLLGSATQVAGSWYDMGLKNPFGSGTQAAAPITEAGFQHVPDNVWAYQGGDPWAGKG
jgi:hypothetical protein